MSLLQYTWIYFLYLLFRSLYQRKEEYCIEEAFERRYQTQELNESIIKGGFWVHFLEKRI